MNSVLTIRSLILFWLIIVPSEFFSPEEQLNAILSTGNLKFSINVYKNMSGEKNLFFSPFSVRVVLAMLAAGAGGRTLTQMNRSLQLDGFQNQESSNSAFRSHLKSFGPNANFTLTTANRMYLRKNYLLKRSFTETVSEYFLSSAENVDFERDPAAVERRINRWVEAQTNGTIKDLIAPGVLTSDTVLFLVNAVYFKGIWAEPFSKEMTKPGSFHLADGRTVEVPMMFITSYFSHAVNAPLKSEILGLNYVGDRLSMYIILPRKGTRLSEVQENLNWEIMYDFISKFSNERVDVSLPKFKIRYRKELAPVLRSLGMIDVFADSADLSGMSQQGGVLVSAVLHQAFVAVDEEGTVAAAATGAAGVPNSPQPPVISFKVDRPCIYFIYDRHFHQILFMGNLDDPSSLN